MKIKNWAKFQHFKDRRPPWIKLYRDIMDDVQWFKLEPEAAKALVMMWVIASEDEGRLPIVETLAFRLRMTEKQVISIVSKLGHWLEDVDIELISDGYQSDAPETERETYRKETETDTLAADAAVCIDLWNSMASRAGLSKAQAATKARTNAIKARLRECGGVEGWTAMLEIVERTPYLCGENDRGWRADLDFVTKQSKFTKIMEGGYGRSSKSTGNRDLGGNGFVALALGEGGLEPNGGALPG